MAKKFDPGVIDGSVLEQSARIFQWVVAGAFLLISWLGTHVQFAGGWDAATTLTPNTSWAGVYALIFQLLCSLGQFSFLKVRAWTWYFGCLGISVAPSVLSYWALTGAWFSEQLTTPIAVLVVIGACTALDCVPERILVKRSGKGGSAALLGG